MSLKICAFVFVIPSFEAQYELENFVHVSSGRIASKAKTGSLGGEVLDDDGFTYQWGSSGLLLLSTPSGESAGPEPEPNLVSVDTGTPPLSKFPTAIRERAIPSALVTVLAKSHCVSILVIPNRFASHIAAEKFASFRDVRMPEQFACVQSIDELIFTPPP